MNRNLGGSLRGITWFSAFSWGAEGRNYFDCQLTAIRGDHKNVIVHYGGSGEFCRQRACLFFSTVFLYHYISNCKRLVTDEHFG